MKISLIAMLSFLFGATTAMVATDSLHSYREATAAATSQAGLDATLRSTCAALAENGARAWVCDPK